MALCAELRHENIIQHIQTILEDKSIYMIFGYCEHDLLQIIHHHNQTLERRPIHAETIRSIMYQLLQGCCYLHRNWVMHRDLKPANIMVTASGQVKIGDLGLARIFREPLVSLYTGDKVVVTIWYRAPELLLGGRHYTPAIDLWAVGCIFGELLSLKPMFKGEEVKMDNRKSVPFQKYQMQRVVDVLGMPTVEGWPLLKSYPDFSHLTELYDPSRRQHRSNLLQNWYYATLGGLQYPPPDDKDQLSTPGEEGMSILQDLLTYNPEHRVNAEDALQHEYFKRDRGTPLEKCFASSQAQYPKRKIIQDQDNMSLPGTKQGGLPDDTRPSKRLKAG